MKFFPINEYAPGKTLPPHLHSILQPIDADNDGTITAIEVSDAIITHLSQNISSLFVKFKY